MPDFLDTVEGPDWLHDAINSLICGDNVTAPRPYGKSVALVTPQSLYEALAEHLGAQEHIAPLLPSSVAGRSNQALLPGRNRGVTMTHHPKGGMCCACQHARRDCSSLPFKAMPPIQRDASTVIVRCTDFKRLT